MSTFAATPVVVNIAMASDNTEYPTGGHDLSGYKRFEFQNRGASAIRFAFETGKVAGSTAPYMTLKGGEWYYSDHGTSMPTLKIYFAHTAGSSQTVELIKWG